MIIYQLQPRLFQALQWLHWRKLNQTCGDRRKRRSCLVVTMIVKFNNSFLQSSISDLEGPLASSLLGHEFHSDSLFPNSGPVLRCIYALRHWHWIKLLRFGGGNSGLRLWNYDLHFGNKFDSVQSIYGWNAVTNSRDNVALRSFFSFTVSGLHAPNSSDSVIAEVLAQECCLHNFNQFDLSQLTFTTRTNGLQCDALLHLCRFVVVALVLGRLGVDNVTLDSLELRTCFPLPDEPKSDLTCQEMFYMPMISNGCGV